MAEPLAGCFDCNCPKCGRKISWQGTWAARPACRCGYRLPEDGATGPVLQEIRDYQTGDAQAMSPQQLRRARELAGLRPGQATKLLGLASFMDLEAIETGRRHAGVELCRKMNKAYGLGGPRPDDPSQETADGPRIRPRAGPGSTEPRVA